MSPVHLIAELGFGQGTNELYDRARPSYQSFVLSYIRNVFKSKPFLNIAETGAGTGIFTRALLTHPEWISSIRQLKAIEPSKGMRQVFASTVIDERVSVQEGTFGDTKVENAWADLVIAAQAFHWCPDYNAAAGEFARVLKPDGAVVLVWNLEDREQASWVAQLRDRIERHEKGTPQFRLNLWRDLFDTPAYKEYFHPPEETTWSYVIPSTLQLTVERACSKSYIATLSDTEKESVADDVAGIVNKGEGIKWIDRKDGTFEYPYKTYVVISRRK